MATVRISNRICADTTYLLNKFYDQKIKEKNAQILKLPIANEAYLATVSEEDLRLALTLMHAQTNKSVVWFDTNKTIPVAICHLNVITNVNRDYIFNADLTLTNYAIPYKLINRPYYKLPCNALCRPEVDQLLNDIDVLEDKKRNVNRDIAKGVLEKCTTLAQVLTVWPSALDFMPEYVRIAHERVDLPKKRKKKEVLANIAHATQVELIKMRLS